MRLIAEFACPGCGTTMHRRWWECSPRRYGRDFLCNACGQFSQFPALRRLISWATIFTVIFGGVPWVFRILDIYGIWPPLIMGAFMLAILGLLATALSLGALVCAASPYLVPCSR